MKRITWLLPSALLVVGCANPNSGKTATYSPSGGTSPMAYRGAPNQNGSSQTPAARPPTTPTYTQPTYTPPPTARATPPTYTQPTPPPPPPPSAYTPPAPPPPPPPTTYAPPPAAPRLETPSMPQAFTWARTLSEAQATARASGRLVFLESGRDACGNCQKLRRETIPSLTTELGTMSVGYYDDCDRDSGSQAFRILQTNLPNAVMLPLVGWVTPDLRWVHGYSGAHDASRFRQEMATAQAKYRQMGAIERPATGPEMAAGPESVPAPAAAAPSASLPDAELADIGPELLGEEAPAAAPTAVATPGSALAATPPTPEAGTRAWAQAELRRAASAVSAHDYAAARAILAEVRTRAPDAPEAREADKGEVAIYNLRRMERAPADAAKVREQAQRDLRDTVWVGLFA